MLHKKVFFLTAAAVIVSTALISCNKMTGSESAENGVSERIKHGEYIVKITGCNDCHTPGYPEADGWKTPRSKPHCAKNSTSPHRRTAAHRRGNAAVARCTSTARRWSAASSRWPRSPASTCSPWKASPRRPEGTARSDLHHARAALRRILKDVRSDL